MALRIHKLSSRKVAAINSPGLYGDGARLWLKVTKSKTKSWIFRYTRDKKTVDMGLGSVVYVSLAEAREAAKKYSKQLNDGCDPLALKRADELTRKQANAELMPFKTCAIKYIESHRAGWKNAKHVQQWENTLTTYVSGYGGFASQRY